MDDGRGDVCHASIATEAPPYHCVIHRALHPVAIRLMTDAGSGYTSCDGDPSQGRYIHFSKIF